MDETESSIKILPNTFQIATCNVNYLQEGTKKIKAMQHMQKLSADIALIKAGAPL